MDTQAAGREEWRAARRALVEELTRLRDGFCHGGWMDRETSRVGDRNSARSSIAFAGMPMGFAARQPILQTCA
jgi:hypothetical protein